MSAPPYQKFFWGSYHKHTAHLSHAREHGAYLLLIAALWNNDGRLPADDDTLAGYARLSLKEWASVKPKLMPLFHVSRGKLTQKRVTEDLAKYRDTSGKRKAAGKAGGEARSRNYSENGQANASRLPTKPEPEPEPEKNIGESAQVLPFDTVGGQAASPRRASRIKPDWEPTVADGLFAVGQGFTQHEVDRIAAKFRDHWTAASGKSAAKLDWSATWRNWIRNEAERRGTSGAAPAKRTGFV